MSRGLTFMDDEGVEVVLDDAEARALLTLTGNLDAATVSACPSCRSRVLATVALVDLLDRAAPHSRTGELIELADDAPTLHLFVVDDGVECRHRRWHDPLHAEWLDVVDAAGPHARR
jgi:hypothetical protein